MHPDNKAPVPSVWAIVLHWRGIEYTRDCLTSLKSLEYPDYHILLVDNGSESGDGARLKAGFDEISVLRLEANFGFSGGCNAGIDYCLNQGSDFIWLLNNDAKVYPDTLSQLMQTAMDEPCSGIVGGVIDEPCGTEAQLSTHGLGTIDFRRARIHQEAPVSDSTSQCEWVSGSSMLLRSTAILDAGKFNDDYFLYYEDVELCVRFRRKGWKCLLNPQAHIAHAAGTSTSGKYALCRYYYGGRNRLYFFNEYASGLNRYTCLGYIFTQLARHFLLAPFRKGNRRTKFKGEYLAFRDFILNRKGKIQNL